MKTHIMLLPFLLLYEGSSLWAQNPSVGGITYDKNWTLQTALSDEFPGTSLSGMWCKSDMFDASWYYQWAGPNDCPNDMNGNVRWDDINVSVGVDPNDASKNVLKLRIDPPTAPAPYDWNGSSNGPTYPPTSPGATSQSGQVRSVNGTNYEAYTYGYFEMSAKLPGIVDGNGVGHGDKFWPAFWLYHVEDNPPGCRIDHDEIDILEPDGYQYADASTNVAGWHDEDGPGFCDAHKVGEAWYTNNTPLCSGYHKFACEWNTDRMLFYFDDIPFYEFRGFDPSLVMNMMRMSISANLGSNYDFYPGTFANGPQYMMVDYFRYYTLNKYCSNSLTFLTAADVTNYWNGASVGVQSNINFGNGSSTISLSPTDKMIFRAVNDITINGELTVPLGTELTLTPTPCY